MGRAVAFPHQQMWCIHAQSRRTLFDDDGDYAAFERVLW